EIANKIFATQFQMTEPINLTKIDARPSLPIIKYGNSEDIKELVCDLNLPADSFSLKSDWAVCMNTEEKVVLKNKFIADKQIPNVKGMGLKNALFILEKLGLKVIPIGMGTVVYQSIPQGTKVRKGDRIFLKLMK
ncbi:MAG TPA: PASTA domain-containing protein, partial [Bacteroidales bacterium]|nr:PASTA domain-containing protein [Bacteroidales bacterium]